ncbi:hypothetical protein ABZX77_52690 [Streptomyces sp. NPDC004237]|uniref:hypothetical protein n=1 Tax=Streptomyces sp. NPDC004237 TaxID=3154455 RepID=UPI0033A659F3
MYIAGAEAAAGLVTVEGSAVAHEPAEAERVHGGVVEDALAAGGRGDVRAGAIACSCSVSSDPSRTWASKWAPQTAWTRFPMGGLHICGVDTAKYLPTQTIYLPQQILQRRILPLMSFCHP